MKKITLLSIILPIIFMSGCSNKEPKVDTNKTVSNSKSVTNKAPLEVEIEPAVDGKTKIITKVKPRIEVISTLKKPKKAATPVIVIDPVDVTSGVDVKAVEILPADEEKVEVKTIVEPTTVQIEEEIPLEEGEAIVIEPLK